MDEFFFKKYNYETYNCAHFCDDVWLKLTGTRLSDDNPLWLGLSDDKTAPFALHKTFKKLTTPSKLCIGLLRNKYEHHVGIIIDGSIFHITENGVQYVPIDTLKCTYRRINFYEPVSNNS